MTGGDRAGGYAISADEWRQIVDSAVDTAIITTDLDGRVRSWNQGARRILGWSETEMLGTSLACIFPKGEGEAALRREREEALRTGRGGGEEGWRVRKDGSRFWATGELTPIRDAQGGTSGYTKILRDRSMQRKAEQEIRDERRALEILNRASSALAAETDVQKLIQIVTDAGVAVSGAAFGAFFHNVIGDDGERYLLYTLSGAPLEAFSAFPMPRNTPIFAPTFTGEAIVRSDDITLDPRYGHNAPNRGMPEGHLPVRSYLAVPVASRSGEVIGGLFFGHGDPCIFTASSEDRVRGLAAEAAVAIDNARLFTALGNELEQRRQAEAELAASEDRLRLANDAANVGTWDFDPQAGTLRWDSGCKALFGLPPDAQVTFEDAFLAGLHPEDRAATEQAVAAALDPAGNGQYDVEYRTVGLADGVERWVGAKGRAVFADGRAVRFIGTVIDLTARKRSEAELRALNERLEERVTQEIEQRSLAEDALRQAQKMEAVGQLTGGIAHDFNNLLTIVTGNIGMAQRALDASALHEPRAHRALDNAMKGAERAASLTQRLLAFARRQPLAPKPIDLDKLVMGLSDLLQRSLGELVRLEIVTSPGLWRVEADPNQLESALLNLAVNARDAMAQGGELTIETANVRLDESYAASQAEVPPGQYVMVAVTDTGSGMPKSVIDRAFEPFFTTKEVGKGSGLGLSMVYGFVKQSGGHVKIYSEEGQGTTIKIYLPRLLRESEADPGPAPTAGYEAGSQRETILVVEDDDDVRAYTVECLRELGYIVLEAHDGPSALRILDQHPDRVDLLFTDVVMPGMSGRELALAARQGRRDLAILYTSGYTRNAIVHGGRLDPGVEVVIKPFTFEGLAQKVRDMLDARHTDCILIAEADAAVRALAGEALEGAGFRVEQAATGAETLHKLRAAQGRYDAIVLDDGLADEDIENLVLELRALRADLPLILTTRTQRDALAQRYDSDPCTGVIARPYTASELQRVLETLEVRCRASRA